MKNQIKYILQKLLGYNGYLYQFARYKIKTLKKDQKEGDFFAFLSEIKGKGDLLDVGANIGIMSYHMAKNFPNKNILAIEPVPSNFIVLKRIVEKYDLTNVEVVPCAVGEKKEKIEMVLPVEGKVKMQGLAHVVHDSINEWNEGEKVTVPCMPLDEIAENIRIAGIKMDIENFEYFALKGAKGILSKFKPIIYLELWENENRTNCFEFLKSFGYSIFVNGEKGLEAFDPKIHKKQNFIFKVTS